MRTILEAVKARPVMPGSLFDLVKAERAGLIERQPHGAYIKWALTPAGERALKAPE